MFKRLFLIGVFLAATVCVCQNAPQRVIPPSGPSKDVVPARDCDEACQQGRQNLVLQKRLIWLTGGLVLVGLLQVGSMVWQGIVMNRTKSDVHTQADLMKRQADLMGEQLEEMRTEGAWTRKVTYDQLMHLGEQSKSSAIASEAARDSAEAALEQIRVVKDKERARLVVQPPPSPPQFTRNLGEQHLVGWLMVPVQNHGFSIASNIRVEVRSELQLDEQAPMTTEYADGWLPSVMLQSESKNISLPLVSDWDTINQRELRNPKLHVGISGRIRYEDVFGGTHETKFEYFCSITKLHPFPPENFNTEWKQGWVQTGGPEANTST